MSPRPRTFANEGRLVHALIDRIRDDPRPSWARKTHGTQFSQGEPDIDACVAGHALKVEAKMPGKGPTPLQAATLRRWEAAGAYVGVVHSLEELEEILARIPG